MTFWISQTQNSWLHSLLKISDQRFPIKRTHIPITYVIREVYGNIKPFVKASVNAGSKNVVLLTRASQVNHMKNEQLNSMKTFYAEHDPSVTDVYVTCFALYLLFINWKQHWKINGETWLIERKSAYGSLISNCR